MNDKRVEGSPRGAGGIGIRKATRADRQAIAAMCKASIRATYGAFMSEEQMASWIEGGETDAYVASALDDMLVLVAEDDAGVCGVASIRDDLIDLMWVALDRRGRGIGGMLLAAAERAVRAQGHAGSRLEVFEPNSGAIRFYERHGWVARDVFPDPQAGVNKVAMVKRAGDGDG